MSSAEEDVTMYTKRLTEMERKLFMAGASATAAHLQWKTFGSRKIHVCETTSRSSKQSRAVTPHLDEPEDKKKRVE